MSTIHLSRSASLFTIGLAAGLLVIGTASANSSNSGIQSDPSWGQEANARASASAASSQQSSASAWSESSNGDHGMTVTTTQSGDSTICMVVEWKRENGGIKKWQYRCDTRKP